MIPLFQIPFKPGLRQPPVNLICQSVMKDGELLLWIDGVNAQDPVVIPLSAVASSRLLMSFDDYLRAHSDIARRVLLAGAGEISPTIAARAIAAMVADPGLQPEAALEMVNGQALDLIDSDHSEAAYFWGKNGPTALGMARTAVAAAA